jgi:hypothetical protein
MNLGVLHGASRRKEQGFYDGARTISLPLFYCSFLLVVLLVVLTPSSVLGLSVPVEVSTIRVFSMSLEDTFRYVVVVYQLLFFESKVALMLADRLAKPFGGAKMTELFGVSSLVTSFEAEFTETPGSGISEGVCRCQTSDV